MANIDNVQLPDGSSYNIVDNTSGFASQSYVDSAVSSITKTTIGLGNVDNTSDLNKPISTATQTALDTLDEDKADKTDIATIESGTTASRAYSVGELVYVGGTLYRVKTAIASGATFTVGTNIEATDVNASLKKLENDRILGQFTTTNTDTNGSVIGKIKNIIVNNEDSIRLSTLKVLYGARVFTLTYYYTSNNFQLSFFTVGAYIYGRSIVAEGSNYIYKNAQNTTITDETNQLVGSGINVVVMC